MRRQIVSAPLQRLVRRRARDRCEYCRLPQLYQEATFHVDHVKPYSKGGKTRPANL
ncbi:MAG: HNH endonuclease, partial [Planctomycetes bacterium]|nr:HNH endonuclease [Planctomycetota bacterium]